MSSCVSIENFVELVNSVPRSPCSCSPSLKNCKTFCFDLTPYPDGWHPSNLRQAGYAGYIRQIGIVIGASLWLWQVNWWSRSIALSLIAWFGCDLFWRARWTQRYPIELKIFGCLCFLWLLMSLNWKPITLEYSQGQEEKSPLTKKDILEVIKEGLSAFSKSPSQQTESETRSALLKPKPHATPVPAQEPWSKPEPPTDMPKDKGTLVLKLTPYVIVERLFVKSDNPEIRGTSLYSFGLVLYAQNNYRTAKNIRQIEITGNAPLDFGDYIGSRTMEGRVINEVEKEFIRRRPYYSLSLVTYPKGGGRVDGDGTERFIQFDLMKAMPTAQGYPMFPCKIILATKTQQHRRRNLLQSQT
jgi:hypothetical protein